MPWLDGFLQFLNSLPPSLLYIVLGLSAFVENVFPPIPGDTITAFGAFLVGAERLSFAGVYGATLAGSLAGFMFLFWVGRILGRRFFIEHNYPLFQAQDIRRAEAWFKKYGYFIILLNRFLPGIRSVISIAGGISQLHLLKVVLLALISAATWNLIWIMLGYSIGNNWETVKEGLTRVMLHYNIAVLVASGIAAMIFLLKVLGKRRPRKD